MLNRYSHLLLPGIIGITFGLLTIFLVGSLNLYQRINHLDKIFHIVGGFLIAWFFIDYFDELKTSDKLKRLIICLAGAALISLVWEFAEHFSSVYGPTHFPWIYHYFYGGNLVDTLHDLIADLSGALLFGLFF